MTDIREAGLLTEVSFNREDVHSCSGLWRGCSSNAAGLSTESLVLCE